MKILTDELTKKFAKYHCVIEWATKKTTIWNVTFKVLGIKKRNRVDENKREKKVRIFLKNR